MSYNKGKNWKKKQVKIEPFIKKGYVENGKVDFNLDGLSKPQIDFVNGVKKTINKEIENKDLTNLFSICMYSSKDDFLGGCFNLKDGLNEEDVWNDYKKDFEVIHPPKILPLGKVSELLNSGLTPFQHKENNKYFEMVWNSLNDGGLSINMNGKNLIKVESENGFRIQ